MKIPPIFQRSLLALLGVLIFLPATARADAVLDAANAYLTSLRQTPDGLSSLNLLTGQSIPASGSLTLSQQQFMIDQLFNQDGSHTLAYSKPQEAAQNVAHGGNYLVALRSTPAALDSLKTLSGVNLPPSGALSTAQIQSLFTQLFLEDGRPSQAYTQPVQTAQNLPHGRDYLQALRSTPEALDSLKVISGVNLPAAGTLSTAQTEALFKQLFLADGKPSQAYSQPVQTAQILPHGRDYLQALRTTPQALTSLKTLSGIDLPQDGPLQPDQTESLFSQLFGSDGKPQVAYSNPVQAAQVLPLGVNYLNALRSTPGALAALQNLTGVAVPKTGPLPADQTAGFFNQLFDDNGLTKAAQNPTVAVQDLLHANAYLEALRQTPGALEALQKVTGVLLPTTGPLSEIQSQVLFKQLYDKNQNTTDAYNKPLETAQLIAEAGAPGETHVIRIVALAALTLATLGLLGSFAFLSAIPMWGWAALAVAGAVMLFVSLFGKKDLPLGRGDVPALSASMLPVVGGLAVLGVGAMSPSQPPILSAPSVRSAPIAPPIVSGSTSPAARDVSGEAISLTRIPESNPVVVGPFVPGQSYRSFYLPTKEGPTGLTPNPAAQEAIKRQRDLLEQVSSNPSPLLSWRGLEAAEAASQAVEVVFR